MENKRIKGGVIPYYFEKSGTVKMMFMIPSDEKYGGRKPQIAKGGVEEGEDFLTGALREANEELGLREDIIISIKKIGLYDNVHVYAAKVESMEKNKYDKFTFETERIVWLTADEFQKKGRDDHKKIVKTTFAMIGS